MQKVVKLLELHVQWIALGIAVLYVAWCGYTCLVDMPLHVGVGIPPIEVPPGDVDPKIREGSARTLELAMKDQKVEAPALAQIVEQFNSGIGMQTVLATATDWNTPTTSTHMAPDQMIGQLAQVAMVTQLPILPPAIPDSTSSRWTVIMPRQDVAYISSIFEIDVNALNQQFNDAFAKANLPLNALFTRVDVLREEMGPNGWGKAVFIGSLPINKLEPYPGELKPAPTPDALKKIWYNYKDWAEKNQNLIIQPPFYEIASGAEAWLPPGNQPAAVIPQPTQPVVRPIAPPVVPPAVIRPRPGAVGPGAFVPRPGQYVRPPTAYAPPPVQPIPPLNPSLPPPLVNPNNGGPAGINPGLANGNPTILVHDVTVQEGHTYRYAVRYKLYNPVFDKPQAVRAVAEKFDIDSPDPLNPSTLPKPVPPAPAINPETLWTKPVTVESRTRIFVQKITPFSEQVDFVVYNWKDGRWHEVPTIKKSPGDPVSVGKDTPWTVVDVRRDGHSNEPYVLLMDTNGGLTRRQVDDPTDPEWQKLKIQAGAAVSAAR